MKLRELDRCYVAGADGVHLAVTICGGRGTHAFCGKRVAALTTDGVFEDVCPRCVSRAKHLGCR